MITFQEEIFYVKAVHYNFHCAACNGRWILSNGEMRNALHMHCPHCGTLDRVEYQENEEG